MAFEDLNPPEQQYDYFNPRPPAPPKPSAVDEAKWWWRTQAKPTLETPILGEEGILPHAYRGAVSSLAPMIKPRVGEDVSTGEKIAESAGGLLGFAPWFAWTKGAKALSYLGKGMTTVQRLRAAAFGAKTAVGIGALHGMLGDTDQSVGTLEDAKARLGNAAVGGLTMGILHNAGIATTAGAAKILKTIAPQMETAAPALRTLIERTMSDAMLGGGMGAIEAPPGQRMMGAATGAAGFALGGLPFGVKNYIPEKRQFEYEKTPYQQWLKSREPFNKPPDQGIYGSTLDATRASTRTTRQAAEMLKPEPPERRTTEGGKAEVAKSAALDDVRKQEDSARANDALVDKVFNDKVTKAVAEGKMTKQQAKIQSDIFKVIPAEQKKSMSEQFDNLYKRIMLSINRESAGRVEQATNVDVDAEVFTRDAELVEALNNGWVKKAVSRVVQIAKENKIKIPKAEVTNLANSVQDIKIGKVSAVKEAQEKMKAIKVPTPKQEKVARIPKKAGAPEGLMVDRSMYAEREKRIADIDRYMTAVQGEYPHIKKVGEKAWAVVDPDGTHKFTSETREKVLEKMKFSREAVANELKQLKSWDTREKNKLLNEKEEAIQIERTIDTSKQEQHKIENVETIKIMKEAGLVEDGSPTEKAGVFGVPVAGEGRKLSIGTYHLADRSILAAHEDGVGIMYVFDPKGYTESVRSGATTYSTEMMKYGEGANPKEFKDMQYQPDAKTLGSTRMYQIPVQNLKEIVITPNADPSALNNALSIVKSRMARIVSGEEVPLIKLRVAYPTDIRQLHADMDNVPTDTILKAKEIQSQVKEAMKVMPFKEATGKMDRESLKMRQYVTFWEKAMQTLFSGQKNVKVGDLIQEVIGEEIGALKGLELTDAQIREHAKNAGLSFSQARLQLNKSVEATLAHWQTGFVGLDAENTKFSLIRSDVKPDTPVSPAIFFRVPTTSVMRNKFDAALAGATRWNKGRASEQYKVTSAGIVNSKGTPIKRNQLGLDNVTNELLKLTRYRDFDADYNPPDGTPPGLSMAMRKLSNNPAQEAKVLLKGLENMVRKNKNFQDIAVVVKGKQGEAGDIASNFKEVFDAFEDYQRKIEDMGREMSIETFIDLQAPLIHYANTMLARMEGVKAKPMKTFGDIQLALRDKLTQQEVQVKDTEIGKFFKSNWQKVVRVKGEDGEYHDAYKGKNKKGQIVFIPVGDVERSIRKYENIRNKFQGDAELILRVLEHFGDVTEATKSKESFEVYKNHMFKRFANEKRNTGIPKNSFFDLGTEEIQEFRKTAVRENESAIGSGKIHEAAFIPEPEPTEYEKGTYIPGERRVAEEVTGGGPGVGVGELAPKQKPAPIVPREVLKLDTQIFNDVFEIGKFKSGGAAGRGFEVADQAYRLNKNWVASNGWKFKEGYSIVLDQGADTPQGRQYHIKDDGWIPKSELDTVAQFADTIAKDNIDLDLNWGGFDVLPFFQSTKPHIDVMSNIERAQSQIRGPIDMLMRSFRYGDVNKRELYVKASEQKKVISEAFDRAFRPEMKKFIPDIMEEFYIANPKDRNIMMSQQYNERQTRPEGAYWDKLTPSEQEFAIDLAMMAKGLGYLRVQEGHFSNKLFDDEAEFGSYFPTVVRRPDGTLISNVTRETMAGGHQKRSKYDLMEQRRSSKILYETDPGVAWEHWLVDYANTQPKNAISEALQSWNDPKINKPAMVYMNDKTKSRMLDRLDVTSGEFSELYENVREFGRHNNSGFEDAYVLKDAKIKTWLNDLFTGKKVRQEISTYFKIKGLYKGGTLSFSPFPLFQGYNSVMQTKGPITGLASMFMNQATSRYQNNMDVATRAAMTRGRLEAANFTTLVGAMYDDLRVSPSQKDGGLDKMLNVMQKYLYDKNMATNWMFERVKIGAVNAWTAEVEKTLRKNPSMDQLDAEILAGDIINKRMGMPSRETFNQFWGNMSKGFLLARNGQISVMQQFLSMFSPTIRRLGGKQGAYPGAQMFGNWGYTDKELGYLARSMAWTQGIQTIGFLTSAGIFASLTGSSMPWDRKDPKTWLNIPLGIKDASGNEITFTPPVFKDIRDILEFIPPFGSPVSYARNKMDPTLRLLLEAGIFRSEMLGGVNQPITNYGEFAQRKLMGAFPPLRWAGAAVAPEYMQNIVDLYPRSAGERTAEFMGVRTQRAWGGGTAKEQNKAYLLKQGKSKLKERMDDLDRQMDIAFANKDMKRLRQLAAQRYAKPTEGLKGYMSRMQNPYEASIESIPKRFRQEILQQVYGGY